MFQCQITFVMNRINPPSTCFTFTLEVIANFRKTKFLTLPKLWQKNEKCHRKLNAVQKNNITIQVCCSLCIFSQPENSLSNKHNLKQTTTQLIPKCVTSCTARIQQAIIRNLPRQPITFLCTGHSESVAHESDIDWVCSAERERNKTPRNKQETSVLCVVCPLREAVAGEEAQRTFCRTFSRSAAKPPPAQSQYPRVELQLWPRPSPRAHTLRSARRIYSAHEHLSFHTYWLYSEVFFGFCVQVTICARSRTTTASCWESCICLRREKIRSCRNQSPWT